MAGAFGALAAKYDLSVQVAHDLIDKIGNQGRAAPRLSPQGQVAGIKLAI
jgi:hypothetical protein